MKGTFEGRLALITGATSGIGLRIAWSLHDQGCRLILTGRNEQVLADLKERFGRRVETTCFRADLSEEGDVHALLGHLKKNELVPDILIHCAGLFHHTRIQDATDRMLEESFRVNFRAPFVLTRSLLDGILGKKGQVLFINSTASTIPKPFTSLYASSKSALRIFAEVLYRELQGSGVRIATIYPGMVATPMQEIVCRYEGRSYNADDYLDPEMIARTAIHLLSLPGNVEIREITIKPV